MIVEYILRAIEIILLVLILAALRKKPATRRRASKKKMDVTVPPRPRYRARVPSDERV